jgi:hypothetical protein
MNLVHIRKSLLFALVFVLLALGISLPPQIRAQVAGATMSGTVTDASGAALAGAQVAIRDNDTGITRTATADGAGFYTVPNLQPGNYEVTFTAPGFATEVQSGVTLTVGLQQVLNMKMKVGQVTETVQVSGEAPSVQLESSSISNTIEDTTVRELPLNGRDWTSLATLQPGVAPMGSLQLSTNNFQRGNRGFGTQMSISGGRPQQNNFRLDGINVNDYVNSGPGSVLGIALGVDAIAEFSVISSNYSAEYGRTSGGVVNAVTRAGTNQWHGSAFYFFRDDKLDARNYFDPPHIVPFHRNQYGGSVGGPILKGKTFFFVAYEGLGQDLSNNFQDVAPSAAADNGLLNFASASAFPSGCVGNGVSGTINGSAYAQCAVTVSPLVKPYLPFWGTPQTLTGLGNTGIFAVVTQTKVSENFVSGRVDHKFSDRDSVFGTYQFDRAPANQPDSLNDVLLGTTTSRQDVILEETHTFSPQFINSVRAGYNRSTAINAFGLSAINPVASDFTLGPDGHSPAPSLVVSGITTLTSGLQTNPSTVYHFNDYQWYDDAFLTKGIHSIKFGFEAERLQENVGQNIGQIAGQYRFGSLVNFLEDIPTSFRGNTTIGSLKYLRQSIFGGYVQDDIRLKQNLTVNVGLRYEMSTVPTEIHGQLSAIGSLTSPILHDNGAPYFSNPTLRNFEPRVGFAWDPFKDGKTSIRGGYGMFDVLPLMYEYAIMAVGTAPYIVTGNETNLAPGSFPYIAYSDLNPVAAAASERVSFVEQNPKRNYVMQWNLSVQRQLMPNLTLSVTYIGNRGIHMPFRADDGDTVVPTLTSAGYLWPCGPNGKAGVTCVSGFLPSGTQAAPISSTTIKPNTNFGRADVLEWDNNSFFDALEVQVEKKMAHGFHVGGAYTWGKSIDRGSGSTHGDPFVNSVSSDWAFDQQQLNRGLSDYNIGQNLVINFDWNIPVPHMSNAFANQALGGWQVGGIFTADTGLPFTPQMGPDPYGTQSTLSYAFPNRITTGAGCARAINPGNPKNYINLNCFALPTAPTSFASQCATFSGAAAPAPSGQVYCANLLGNAGRNSLIGPGLVDLNFSVFKNFPIRRISEQFNAQFRFEAFNILNHPNFVAPIDNEQIFNSSGAPITTAGRIDTTSTTSRQLQLALKLTW